MKKISLLIAALSVCALANAQASLSALSGFGTNGWVAPAVGTPLLGADNGQRGMAWNPVTRSVYVSSRNPSLGNSVFIYNGSTGALGSAFNFGSAGVVSGGTFAFQALGVNNAGNIYMSNTSSAGGTLRVYKWNSEADAIGTAGPAVQTFSTAARTGDHMDLFDDGTTTTLAFGITAAAGFVRMTDAGGSTFTGNFSTVAVGAAGQFRQGITFGTTADTVWGKESGANAIVVSNNGVLGTGISLATGQAPIDVKVIDGITYLAALDVNSSVMRVYTVSGSTLTEVASGTTITGTSNGNANGSGSIKFGNLADGTHVLYALNTNNGLQAMVFNPVPEPMTMSVLGLAALAALRKRRNKKS